MTSRKYPLDPLARVRRDRRDLSGKELAQAITAREAAERGRAAAEAERARVAEETRRTKEAERAALDRGQLSAGDLQRESAWAARARWDDEARAAAVDRTKEHESAARSSEERAKQRAAVADGEVKVVEKHRERWVKDADRAAEAAAEEGAAEAWRPRR